MPLVDPVDRPIGRLLRVAQVADPEDLVGTLSLAVAELGGSDVVLYLVDYEQTNLIPHPDVLPHGGRPAVVSVDGSMAGRAFLSNTPLASDREDGWHVWVPVTDRANRLGVLSMTLPEWDDAVEYYCFELGLAAAHLLLACGQYTDLPYMLRRRRDLGLAAEMQWSLLPPLSFSLGGTTVGGLLEPAYRVAGDCFDYAVNFGHLDIAIFDAVGHGLNSAVLASLLVGAYRNGRRDLKGLQQLAGLVDAAVREYPAEPAFATAIFAQLNVATGRLTWTSCGHPQPLHVRNGNVLAPVEVRQGVPVGMGDIASPVGEVIAVPLQAGDAVLFYTDGVVEARNSDGVQLGEERLRDLLAREHMSGRSPQEILRRLVRAAADHQNGRLSDDASMVYLQWDGPTALELNRDAPHLSE